MRLLLDTHVAMWSIVDPGQIPRSVKKMIEDSESHVSAVSIVELSIKFSANRRRDRSLNAADTVFAFQNSGFILLDLTPHHAASMQSIAVAHPDPYDRLLLAQALSESMHFVTHDQNLARYSDTVITW